MCQLLLMLLYRQLLLKHGLHLRSRLSQRQRHLRCSRRPHQQLWPRLQ